MCSDGKQVLSRISCVCWYWRFLLYGGLNQDSNLSLLFSFILTPYFFLELRFFFWSQLLVVSLFRLGYFLFCCISSLVSAHFVFGRRCMHLLHPEIFRHWPSCWQDFDDRGWVVAFLIDVIDSVFLDVWLTPVQNDVDD